MHKKNTSKLTKIKGITLYVIAFVLFLSCTEKEVKTGQISLIPLPKTIITDEGFFEVNAATSVSVENEEQLGIAELFFKEFENTNTWSPQVALHNKEAAIQFVTDINLQEEGYELHITAKGVNITAANGAGFFYALQSFRQLMPPSYFESSSSKNLVWQIPAVHITDAPAFKWRGYMLDVSRHFFDKEHIKEVLDFMAQTKLNRFHWHLSDDQGWRLEIKKYPKLTSIGAWRVDYNVSDENISNWWGRPVQKKGDTATYGGYYTQDDIKEIVAYAKERYIEVIPEIDMPGHSLAALAAYPEISCSENSFYVGTGGVNKNNALCPGKEETFKFVEDVLGEVMELFPFEYIHIGGDECNKDSWKTDPDCQLRMKENGLANEKELQSYFIKRVEKIVNTQNKKMIGWDEILQGGLAPNATVMSWRGEKGGIAAAKLGHDVIMTPAKYTYLDLKQGSDDLEPNLGYAYSFLKDTYNFKIVSDSLSPEQGKHIMGLQGNLWTESINDWEKLTYMTFPRLYAVAENGWSGENRKDWNSFTNRLRTQFNRWDRKNIRYARSAFNVNINHKGTKQGSINITLNTEVDSLDVRYTLDGSTPTLASLRYKDTFVIKATATLKATSFLDGKQIGTISEQYFPIHKGFGAKVKYHAPATSTEQAAQLVDLNYATLNRWNPRWQPINGDLEVDLIFDTPTTVEALEMTCLRFTIGGVYLPETIIVFGSVDGEIFEKLGELNQQEASYTQGRNKIKSRINFDKTTVQILKVKAKRINTIPKGHHQAGKASQIKIDEFIVY